MFDGEWMDCPRGTTPLHLAARLGQQELALLILQQYVSRGDWARDLGDLGACIMVHDMPTVS